MARHAPEGARAPPATAPPGAAAGIEAGEELDDAVRGTAVSGRGLSVALETVALVETAARQQRAQPAAAQRARQTGGAGR